MLSLMASLFRPVAVTMDVREVRTPTATPAVTTAKPTAKAGAPAAAPAAAPADTGAAVKDSFSSNAPAKPMQQANLINPMTVARLSLVGAKQLPKELLANVAAHVKDTQKKVSSMIPQKTEAPKGRKGGKGGGRKGGKASQLFDDGGES